MPPLVDPPARTINLGWTGSRRLRREQPARVELSKSRRLERRRREEVSMKLYEFPPTRSIRPRWMLQELEVPFESVWVDLPKGEHRSADFLKLNPAGKVPVLVDGDVVLNESVAIVLYLAAKYAEKGFLPGDRKSRAEMDRWLLFTVTELEQPLWRIAKHTALLLPARRIPDDVALARQDFEDMAPVLEHHLEHHEFVAGDRVTAADFVVAYTLDWANENGLLGGFPASTAYMERMYRRPKAALRIREAFKQIQA
jgi:glutathione S-transferase